MFNLRIALLCVAVQLTIQFAHSETVNESQFNDLLAEHKQAVDLIQNFSCKMVFRTTHQTPGASAETHQYQCDYWHAGDSIRLKSSQPLHSYEYVWKDGIRLYLQTRINDGKTQYAATKSGRPFRYNDRCDVWSRAILAINVPGTSQSLPLQDFVKRASRIEKIWSFKRGDATLTTVRLCFDKSTDEPQEWRVDVTLDRSINTLVRRVTHYVGSTPETSEFRREEEVVATTEPRRGVIIPSRIKGRSGVGEQLDASETLAEISSIQIDKEFSTSTFQLKLPNGIHLVDSTKGVSYNVNSSGKPISKPAALGQFPPPSLADGVRSDGSQTASTSEEESRLSQYVIGFALALVTLAGVVLWRRRMG